MTQSIQPDQPTNNLADLYKAKGELITQLEIIQAKLQQVNQEIAKLLNLQPIQPK